MRLTFSLQIFCSCWHILFSTAMLPQTWKQCGTGIWHLALKNPAEKSILGCARTLTEASWIILWASASQFWGLAFHFLQASCLQQLYCYTENRLAEKSATLKQPEQIQKRGCIQSKLIIKSADSNDNVIKTSAKVTRLVMRPVTRHKRNHRTPGHDKVKTPST